MCLSGVDYYTNLNGFPCARCVGVAGYRIAVLNTRASRSYVAQYPEVCETTFCPTCPQAHWCDKSCQIGYCAPTASPTTAAPTQFPTQFPTQPPTQFPTPAPSQLPTQAPTHMPTQAHSALAPMQRPRGGTRSISSTRPIFRDNLPAFETTV